LKSHSVKIFEDPLAIQAQGAKWRKAGKSTGFVPTMGALHQGHMELVRASQEENDVTVVSIYVNPIQFGPNEDYNRYPRTLEADLGLLKDGKVGALYLPDNRVMYPKGFNTRVSVGGTLLENLCAPFRPGHFEGVATVVVKLVNAVQPNRLYLGQKDVQQAIILQRVLRDLDFDLKVRICPIVREPDGLAMSSRNKNLSLEGRAVAPVFYKALKVGKSIVDLGETDAEKVLDEIKNVIQDERSVKLQYLEAVHLESLSLLRVIEPGKTLIALAAYLDNVRLIDNIVV
jgi:pantoate--beta-alanine ligase